MFGPTHPGASRPASRLPPERRPRFVLGGVVLIRLAAGGARYWLNARHLATTNDACIDACAAQIASRVAGQVTELLLMPIGGAVTGRTIQPKWPMLLALHLSLDIGAARSTMRDWRSTSPRTTSMAEPPRLPPSLPWCKRRLPS